MAVVDFAKRVGRGLMQSLLGDGQEKQRQVDALRETMLRGDAAKRLVESQGWQELERDMRADIEAFQNAINTPGQAAEAEKLKRAALLYVLGWPERMQKAAEDAELKLRLLALREDAGHGR